MSDLQKDQGIQMSSRNNQPTMESMIAKAGGLEQVAVDLGLTASMVRKWLGKNAMPWWHWHYFIEKGYTAAQIYNAIVLAFGESYANKQKAARQNKKKKA